MATQDTGLTAFASLGADINKQNTSPAPENTERVISDKLPELTLEMKDEDIVSLTEKWEKEWKESPKKSDWEKQIKDNEDYWLGKQTDKPLADKTRSIVDNLIFEATETWLPQATRRNPEPIVNLDSSQKGPEGSETPAQVQYVDKVKRALADLGDKNRIRLKLKKAARHWAIYQLGVVKYGWDMDSDIPVARVIRPQRVILDPNASIDEDGYTGDRIGEYRRMKVSKILAIIGEKEDQLDAEGKLAERGNSEAIKALKDSISKDGQPQLDTEIQFIEWWTKEYFCWKFNKHILLKKKNPHWNYDLEKAGENVDIYGNAAPVQEMVAGLNHFPSPRMPYSFISVFNLGDQPMDKTGLINQNLSNQDMLNKRNRQIDKNADNMNNGMVVSLERAGMTQPQAEKVVKALRKGGAAVIPAGIPREAIDRIQGQNLPADVYNDLVDKRARLRDIFGVSGSSQAGLQNEETVRGKIMSRGLDTDRIGGGVTEHLEQLADSIYNWFLQLLYVYDPAFQFLEGTPPKVLISVKEGSMLPKDSLSLANQAIELASINRISTLDLFKKLDYPNAEELAANVWLEVNAPHLLYQNNPLIAQAFMEKQMMAQAEAEGQAEAKKAESEQSHEQALEKEVVKGGLKIEGEERRSILSKVPQG